MSRTHLATAHAFLVVMGVAGTGKTEIAKRLAERIGGDFVEADEFHPIQNVDQMRKGIPLTDSQRWPWLGAVCDEALTRNNRPVVIACSALKRCYRDMLRARLGDVRFLFLDGPTDLIAARLQTRRGHFATRSLLESQVRTLEKPEPDEKAIWLDSSLTLEDIVQDTIRALTGS